MCCGDRWIGGEPAPGGVIGAVPARPRGELIYTCAFCADDLWGHELAAHPCFRPFDWDTYDPDEQPYVNHLDW